MRPHLIILLLISLVISSCDSSSGKKAKTFYDEVNRQLDQPEPVLNQLADSVIAIQKTLRSNNEYLADTAKIRSLLHTATEQNARTVTAIRNLEDRGPATGFKQAALTYASGWQDLLQGVFLSWLSELGQPIENKADHFEQLMMTRLKEVDESSRELTKKSRAFKKEFGF